MKLTMAFICMLSFYIYKHIQFSTAILQVMGKATNGKTHIYLIWKLPMSTYSHTVWIYIFAGVTKC